MLRTYNTQMISNDQYIANSNRKLKKLHIIHKQTLMDYISKQTMTIGICAKTWEDQFLCNVYNVYNQCLTKVGNVIYNSMQKYIY